jgi:hypothetical protein
MAHCMSGDIRDWMSERMRELQRRADASDDAEVAKHLRWLISAYERALKRSIDAQDAGPR